MFSAATSLKSGQFNHQETVPFWRSFIGAAPAANNNGQLLKKRNITIHRSVRSLRPIESILRPGGRTQSKRIFNILRALSDLR